MNRWDRITRKERNRTDHRAFIIETLKRHRRSCGVLSSSKLCTIQIIRIKDLNIVSESGLLPLITNGGVIVISPELLKTTCRLSNIRFSSRRTASSNLTTKISTIIWRRAERARSQPLTPVELKVYRKVPSSTPIKGSNHFLGLGF